MSPFTIRVMLTAVRDLHERVMLELKKCPDHPVLGDHAVGKKEGVELVVQMVKDEITRLEKLLAEKNT